jgi:uncharacterized membrane protein
MIGYYIKLYFATLAVFLAVDMIWLGLVAKGFYRKQIGFLMLTKPNWTAAILFYLLFVAGLMVFVVVPGLNADSLSKTLLLAAFFGLVTYATYDLTNLATVKSWPLLVTVIDLLWGAVLSIVVSFLSFRIGKLLE